MKFRNYTLHCCTILLVTLFSSHVAAQDRNREIGLRSTNLEDFGAIYKWQKSENTWGRLSLAYVNIGVSTEPDRIQTGAGITIGSEKRKVLASKTEFLNGPQWIVQASYSDIFEFNSEANFAASLGFGWLLGIQYKASDRFNVGIEFTPSVQATYNSGTENIGLSASGGFTNPGLFATFRFSSPQKAGKE